ncbi:MAG: hypothetical protein NTU86_13130 [Burkholderiales bacterium]|nr:hypothetical protein [Burkholderiales bacterium]
MFGVMLGGVLVMLKGMELVAVRELRVVRCGSVVSVVVVLVRFTVVMRRGFQVLGCFFVVVVLAHCRPLG